MEYVLCVISRMTANVEAIISSAFVMEHKSNIRGRVWTALKKVAYPDSRFHDNFDEFIPDFVDSTDAVNRLMQLSCYISCKTIFVTPDNCLEELRRKSLEQGKKLLITTYGIRRGFWMIDPAMISATRYEYAATLDGLERVARNITLSEMLDESLKIDLMVTGAGAINMEGVRFGNLPPSYGS